MKSKMRQPAPRLPEPERSKLSELFADHDMPLRDEFRAVLHAACDVSATHMLTYRTSTGFIVFKTAPCACSLCRALSVLWEKISDY